MRRRFSRRLFETNEARMQKRSLATIALIAAGSTARLALAQVPTPRRLSLSEAEQIALRNHPRIGSANLQAQAAKAVVTESRSAYYPFVNGDFTSVGAEHKSTAAA